MIAFQLLLITRLSFCQFIVSPSVVQSSLICAEPEFPYLPQSDSLESSLSKDVLSVINITYDNDFLSYFAYFMFHISYFCNGPTDCALHDKETGIGVTPIAQVVLEFEVSTTVTATM
jgi:hypothetical protein